MNEYFDPYDIGRETSGITPAATPLSPEALEQAQKIISPPSTETVPNRKIPWSQQYLDEIEAHHTRQIKNLGIPGF